MQGWLDWLVHANEEYGTKAQEIVTGIWPQAVPVMKLVSLGIQVVGTMDEIWGRACTRPVGTHRNPETGELTFTPQVLDLTQARAEQIISTNDGYGHGIRQFAFRDDANFKGDYNFWIQVERIGHLLELPPRNPQEEPHPLIFRQAKIDIDGFPNVPPPAARIVRR